MSASTVDQYLGLMDDQREAMLRRLQSLDGVALWERPCPDSWSIGEHLDHTRVLLRSFRRLLRVAYVLLWPLAWLLHRRPYPTEMADVYKAGGFPSAVGKLWPPHYSMDNPVSLETLGAALADEHQRTRRFFESRDERILGHVWLYDPLVGWVNMVQALRVGVFHDAHHYAIAESRLEARKGR